MRVQANSISIDFGTARYILGRLELLEGAGAASVQVSTSMAEAG